MTSRSSAASWTSRRPRCASSRPNWPRAALEAAGAARALVAEHELGRALARAALDSYTPIERGEAPGGAGRPAAEV